MPASRRRSDRADCRRTPARARAASRRRDCRSRAGPARRESRRCRVCRDRRTSGGAPSRPWRRKGKCRRHRSACAARTRCCCRSARPPGWSRLRCPRPGFVMRCTLPESSVTTASPGACFSPPCTTTSDLPSAFQDTAGIGCPESAAGPSSATLRSVPPSAGITMHLRVAVFHPQEGQRTAIRRPHGRHVAALSLGQLLRLAGRQFAHEDVKRAHLANSRARCTPPACRRAISKGTPRTPRPPKAAPAFASLAVRWPVAPSGSPAPPPNRAPAPTSPPDGGRISQMP